MGVRGLKPCFHRRRECAQCARKKQFCQSELLNIAAAPCYYRSGVALCYLSPFTPIVLLLQRMTAWMVPGPLFFPCPTRQRLRKTMVASPNVSRRNNVEKIFRGQVLPATERKVEAVARTDTHSYCSLKGSRHQKNL